MTIEDPVEYVFPTINQIQINEQAGITFATGLQSILRQDPDVILVGEIRDVETARIAVQSALTGHLVLSSLHATDAVAALHRFLDMGIEPFLIASSVLGVVGQRLVRRICPSARTPYDADAPTSSRSTSKAGMAPKADVLPRRGLQLLRRHRLPGPHRRLRGAAVTDEMKQLVVDRAHATTSCATLAVDAGHGPLATEAIRLVERDVTTIAEVLRTVYVL